MDQLVLAADRPALKRISLTVTQDTRKSSFLNYALRISQFLRAGFVSAFETRYCIMSLSLMRVLRLAPSNMKQCVHGATSVCGEIYTLYPLRWTWWANERGANAGLSSLGM